MQQFFFHNHGNNNSMKTHNEKIVSRPQDSTLVVRKWMSFVASIWIMAISGSNFDFSIYSSTLKRVLNINQIMLNNLAVASDLGKLMGWVSGVACMSLPTWAVLAISVTLGFVGYGVQWLVISGLINPLPYWMMYLLCMMAGNSICWLNTVCFRVAISNFPSKRGIASGLSTSYAGLSTVIYTNLSSLINPGNPSFYLLLNAFVPVIVCLIGALFINIPEPESAMADKNDEKNMYAFTFIAIITAIYSIAFEFLPHGDRSHEVIYMGILVFLMLCLLYVPLKESLSVKKLQRNASSRVTDLEIVLEMRGPGSIMPDQAWEQYINEIGTGDFYEVNSNGHANDILEGYEDIPLDCMEQGIETPRVENQETINPVSKQEFLGSVPQMGEEHQVLQLLRSLDFWLYYFVYFCGGTIGLVYINNLGQIIQSLGYSKTQKLVSLVSSLGFLGRIASGLPDYFKCLNRGLPRPAWLGVWTLPIVPALFMLAYFSKTLWVLYLSSAIIGTAAGAITSVAVPISSELFGMERFGVNHNILISNIAFGSLLFGNMAGLVYDRAASPSLKPLPFNQNMTPHGLPDNSHLCFGRVCYTKTLLAWGCVCSFGFILSVILCLRTRKLYKTLYSKRTNVSSS